MGCVGNKIENVIKLLTAMKEGKRLPFGKKTRTLMYRELLKLGLIKKKRRPNTHYRMTGKGNKVLTAFRNGTCKKI